MDGTAADAAEEFLIAKFEKNRIMCNGMYAKAAKEWLDLKYPPSDPKSRATAATTASKSDTAKCESDLKARGVSAHHL